MLEHKGTVELETERLLLRRFRADDVYPMFENWASDPNVTRYLCWTAHKDVRDTQAIVEKWLEDYSRSDTYRWAIEWKTLGQPIGDISVVRIDEDVDACEIGYCIGAKWWRQGVTSEALRAVMQFLFDTVHANRICAKHDVRNVNSGRVMQKCGMAHEGTLRRAGRTGLGEICDLEVYAKILR